MSSQPSPTGPSRRSASVTGAVASAAAGGARSAPDQKALRVLIVTPRYLPEIGGVENHVHAVATRMAAGGETSVTVLTTDLAGELAPRDRDGDAGVLRVRAYPRSRDWRYAPGIARTIRGGDWDVVHLQSYHTFVAPQAMAAAARAQIPYVVTFHGGGHSDWLRHRVRGLQRAALRPLLARAAALIATARFEIDEYASALRIPTERFVLIPNGFDLPPAPASGAQRSPGGRPLIASLGRLERYKGHQRVIAALPAVRASEPEARLWVAGSGPYEAQLRRQVSQLGLEDAVEISSVPLGERAEMARRLSEVDLAVALSEFETHPMAALEVLSLRRPLLVATGSGLGELADAGYARAIDPHAPPQEIAAAIMRELRDPLAPAQAQFPSWDDCAAQLLALYRRVRRPA